MSIIHAIKQGLKHTWRYKAMFILLYLMTFILAFFVAYPLKQLLESTVGHSMMLNDLVKGFDYTFLNDFKNAYGAGFYPIINQSLAVLGLYMLLFIFFTGGIISIFLRQPDRYSRSIFWGQSAHFFARFFRLTCYFLIIHAIVFGIFGYSFYESVHGLSPFELENEATIAANFKILAPIYVLVAALFFMWQDYTKIILINQDYTWTYKAQWSALKFIGKHFRQTYSLYLFNLLIWALIAGINYCVANTIDFKSSGDIWFSFLMTQVFVMARLILKVFNLGSCTALYQDYLSQK